MKDSSGCTTDLNFQQEQVLGLLKSKGYGHKVYRWEFSNLKPRVEDFTTRVHELRHDLDLNIQCVNEGIVERVVDGIARRVRCTSYILRPGSWRELRGKPDQECRANKRQEAIAYFEREFGKPKPPAGTTDSTTIDLPLFDGVRR